LRSLHPPGGATALLMALTGTVDPSAALFPVFTNSLLLTAAGVAYNNLTRRSYPHPAPAVHARRATEEDLDAVLSRYNQILDIDRDDLRALVDGTQLLTHQRRLADTRCSDLLTREVATASIGTTLEEAWALLRAQDIKTLPVVDRAHHVVGIVTLTDFLDAAGFEVHAGLGARLRSLVRVRAGRTGRVGDIMTRKVRVTREHRSLADLVLLFGSTRHRQIPVVDPDGKLVGMITQTDVVSALKDAEAGNSGPRA
jgi:CBS domain-containing membrane protein